MWAEINKCISFSLLVAYPFFSFCVCLVVFNNIKTVFKWKISEKE